MSSQKYKDIKDKLTAKQPFNAFYNGGAKRALCPHVLGYKKENSQEVDDEEVVLCYQLAENGRPEAWRCFFLSKLTLDATTPAGPWKTPSDYTNKKWQNSVQKAKHSV